MFELADYVVKKREGKIAQKLADAITSQGNCKIDLYKREVHIPEMDSSRDERNRISIRRLLSNFSGSCHRAGDETVIVPSEEFNVDDAFVRRLEENIRHLIERTHWLPNYNRSYSPLSFLPNIGEKGEYPKIFAITINRRRTSGEKGLVLLSMKLGNFFDGNQPYIFFENPWK